jgi:peptidyl-tRNA hydrolase
MKQVLVVNSDLALPAGKMAAQVAHASIAAFLIADNANRQEWLDVGMPKIVLAGENEAQMQLLLRQAREAGVPAYRRIDRRIGVVEIAGEMLMRPRRAATWPRSKNAQTSPFPIDPCSRRGRINC